MHILKKYCFFLCCLLCAFRVSASNTETQMVQKCLNSDRIKYFFGNYGVEVLDLNSSLFPKSRISNLHSIHDGKKVMRTLAVVDFTSSLPPSLQKAHQEIENGGSIGIVLRQNGWTIQKKAIYFGKLPLSSNLMQWMDEQRTSQANIYIYLLEVSKEDSGPIPYCTITEVYSPQYLTEDHLKTIYKQDYENHLTISSEKAYLLAKLKEFIYQFPEI
ncbi:MAG: hypothetical protein S4CHLAM7_04760 [Chlamydiae bacterium]|nr:hypothetical protein [Chlamydiota bacterium]